MKKSTKCCISILGVIAIILLFVTLFFPYDFQAELSSVGLCKPYEYKVISKPTPNVTKGRRNEVKGIVLHHTASFSIEQSLKALLSSEKGVSCHALIDMDGTVYELASPTAITWHAGYSRFNGREVCNNFTIGIEFQGNTCLRPLTDAQIKSAITYLKPIIKKYHISLDNIVTHKMIRDAYLEAHKDSDVPTKVDITQGQYQRFMERLKAEIK